jgi:HSP20 family protein
VELYLPGVKKENLTLTITDSNLVIRGNRECRKNADSLVKFQQCCGKFEKTINLPLYDITIENIESSLSNGILLIKIPKGNKIVNIGILEK